MTGNSTSFQILGYALRVERPHLLVFAALVVVGALVIAYGVWARTSAVKKLVRARRLEEKVVPAASVARPAVAGALTSVALALLCVALTGPKCGERSELAKRFGSDLVIAIDASHSMQARDVLPSRIDRAKLELSALIDRLNGDRVGVVVFAGQAFVQCPLTTDYGAAKLFLRAIDPEAMPVQGTALADALITASDMLRNADRGAKGKAVLLLTDGEDHEGDVDSAVEALAADGVRVYTLGIGSSEGTPIPVLNREGEVIGYRKDRTGKTVVTRLEDSQLKTLADRTGGKYFSASGGDIGMGEVFAELDRLEKDEFESRLTVQYADVYEYFAFPAFLLLLVAATLREGRRT